MSDMDTFHAQNRDAAIQWARELMQRTDWCILDTETTGLSDRAEIVQIGILAASGRVILDALVHPMGEIAPDATAIHGITPGDVAHVSRFDTVFTAAYPVLRTHEIVIYNAAYDMRLLRQSTRATGLDVPNIIDNKLRFTCAMQHYAAFDGVWNEYHQSYRWPKLPGGDHTAIGDCRATLAVIQTMASAALSSEGGAK